MTGHADAELKSPPLPPLETALVGVTALHLCFLPWALGTMHPWSQFTSGGLAFVGFVLSLLPRTDEGCSAAAGASPAPVERLWRFPVFWAGLLLLGYIMAQGLNPAWRFVRDANSWWLEPIAHLSWLPSGVTAPFEQSSPWRALVIFGSLWLLVCSVWVGFSRRQSYRVLFTVLTGNAFLLVLLGGLQQLSSTQRIFWSYLPSNGRFCASFIYPNHAGAYFNLMVALAAGLALWHWRRARHALSTPGPARIFTVFAASAGLIVIFSYSKMSIVLLLAFTALLGGALAWRLSQRKGPIWKQSEFLPLAVVLAGFLGFSLISVQSEKVWERFSELLADPAHANRDRAEVRHAAGEMLRDHWLFGWGAGCFRYVFPLYAQKYPFIYTSPRGERKFWEHAHDDLLEFPVEYGIAGLLPVTTVLGLGAWQLVRRRFWRNSISLCLGLAGVLLLVHAWVDFVFQNPSVLLTSAVLFAGALRWTELDGPALRPRRLNLPTGCTPERAAASLP